jgi:putative Ca2+/H+ antiporter (TMEM165/GDT1 family)
MSHAQAVDSVITRDAWSGLRFVSSVSTVSSVVQALFSALSAVVAGTTLGMLLANVPVVLLGERLTSKNPLRLMRVPAAPVFVVLGVAAIVPAAPLQ